MNANVPTDICFSFAGLLRRGGERGPHRDGWGIAFYDGKGCRAFHDPQPSACSEIARFIRGYAIKSRIVICHIRRAGRTRVALENTPPSLASCGAAIGVSLTMVSSRASRNCR
jgi:predicted glutamine amidotransferase